MTIAEIVLICLLFSLLIEVTLRFYLLRYSPLRIRLGYALFLLSAKRVTEDMVVNQRIRRGGFRNEKELFEHYQIISGKPYPEIEKRFGRQRGWRSLFGHKYYSGGHGAIEQIQKMHLGLTAKPNQKLQTLEIDNTGFRKTGFEFKQDELAKNKKICLLLGGSVAFGAGATADENTIAGRIGYYLNKYAKGNSRFFIINRAMLGFNSLQELIALLQSEVRPDYVISFSGWNEVDQMLFSSSKVSSLSKSCDSRTNDSIFNSLTKELLNRLVIFSMVKRFIRALIAYDSVREEKQDSDTNNMYPLY